MSSFQHLKNVLEVDLATVGAPLLHSKFSTDGNRDEIYFVHGAPVPICPFQ